MVRRSEGSELALVCDELTRLGDEVEALLGAVDAELRKVGRALASSRYARVRRLADPIDRADSSSGALARALRARRLPVPAEAPAMPPYYGGPAHWPRAVAGRSQLKE